MAAIPSVLTAECYTSPPPTADDLINALERYRITGITDPWEARFLLMSDHYLMQTDAVGLCNGQLQKTREWHDKHRDLEKKNGARRTVD